jgi:hypothetical protein
MKKCFDLFLGFFFIAALTPPLLASKDLVYIDSCGESNYLNVNSSDHFDEVIQDIVAYAQTSEDKNLPLSLNLLITDKQLVINSQNKGRNYYAPLSAKEKKDLVFIITTIAWEKNPKKLWDLEDELNKAKERIFHLHPFKFLEGICTDEKLCTGLKAIRERTILVWPQFVKGCVTTLKIEHKLDNVHPYLEEFANVIGVDSKYLWPSAKKENWEEFVKVVAEKVKRNNDPNRYDM